LNHYFNTNVVGNEEVSRTDRLSKPCNVIIVVAVGTEYIFISIEIDVPQAK